MTHKLAAGQPAIIKAGEYNAAMEAGQWFSQQRQLGGGMSGVSLGINPCVVMVKNESGGDLAAGAVVELGASLLTTLDKSHVWLSASTRSGNGVCGVLLDPIPYNSIGPCQVSGICLASVDIQDADNTHARVVPSSTQLKGDFGGYVRIVQKPSGTGVKACLVELGNHQSIIRKARSTSTISASGSGTANVYINGSSVGSITVYHDWVTTVGDIASGLDIYIEYMHDQDKWIALAMAATPATHPVLLRDANVITTSGSTYPRGGSTYSASERYTVGYQETIGSRTDNHITPMVVSSSDEPFCEILTTGLYLLRLHCTVSMSGDASSFETYTTSGPSTGTSHTHTVDADDGNDVIAGVRSLLYRRVGGSGSFTALGNQSNGRWTVCLPHYAAGISGCPYASCYWHCFLNLTATWQLRQWVLFEATSTATQNLLFNEASISLQYLGEQSTAVAIT